jgi:hypothetical protein
MIVELITDGADRIADLTALRRVGEGFEEFQNTVLK